MHGKVSLGLGIYYALLAIIVILLVTGNFVILIGSQTPQKAQLQTAIPVSTSQYTTGFDSSLQKSSPVATETITTTGYSSSTNIDGDSTSISSSETNAEETQTQQLTGSTSTASSTGTSATITSLTNLSTSTSDVPPTSVTVTTTTSTTSSEQSASTTGESTTTIYTTSSVSSDTSTAGEPGLPLSVVARIVQARIYQVNAWTLPGENSTEIGEAIASLRPTYVAGLIRLNSTEPLNSGQIGAFNTIRSIVLQVNPDCKFDVFLTATQYNSSSQIVSEMEYVNSKLKVNIFDFDFYYNEYEVNPGVIGAAISYAHSQGQYIGGNVWGTRVPPGSDFAVANDVNFTLSHSEITALENYHIPILVDLNNNPQNNGSLSSPGNIDGWAESCYYIYRWSEAERADYISELAANQSSWGYYFMYGAFFPTCPTNGAYNSLTDGSMFETLETLVYQYN